MVKKKLAIYGATGCRTCENLILDTNYQMNALSRFAQVLFWPYLLGSQFEDLAGLDKIDVCFFTGAISTQADRKAAMELRAKSEVMVACGACAAYGGMPGLKNLAGGPRHSLGEPMMENELLPELPSSGPEIAALPQVVSVDYFIPGCPPTLNLVWAALQALVCVAGCNTQLSYAVSRLPEAIARAITAGVLPPHGSTFAGEKAVCASCSRTKEQKRFETLKRPYEKFEESGRCLLEQGLICQGIATREGCGGVCTAAAAPCRGCFGKTDATYDAGARMVSAISSTFTTENPKDIERIVDKFEDLAGTFYRYTFPTQCTLLHGAKGTEDVDNNI